MLVSRLTTRTSGARCRHSASAVPQNVGEVDRSRDPSARGLGKVKVVRGRGDVALVKPRVARVRQHLIDASSEHDVAAQKHRDRVRAVCAGMRGCAHDHNSRTRAGTARRVTCSPSWMMRRQNRMLKRIQDAVPHPDRARSALSRPKDFLPGRCEGHGLHRFPAVGAAATRPALAGLPQGTRSSLQTAQAAHQRPAPRRLRRLPGAARDRSGGVVRRRPIAAFGRNPPNRSGGFAMGFSKFYFRRRRSFERATSFCLLR
jgi:hypothetical protein